MKTIRFDNANEESGLRIIVLNGLVEYTETKGVYRIPNYLLEMLDEHQIPYEIVDEGVAQLESYARGSK